MTAFEEIVGQERAVARLRRALRDRRVPHAYLFTGARGVGKSECARAMAQAQECRRLDDDGCGSCDGCLKVRSDRHPDVLTLAVPEGRKRILIKQVRELQHGMAYRPFEGRCRVVLVPDAEIMTEEAANALLKTLEEPPEETHFILTSSQPKSLLDTIRSRCQELRFAPLPRAALTQRLREDEELGPEDARVLASLAEGSPGRAAELLEGGVLEERAVLVRRIASLSPARPVELLELSEAWYRERDRVPDRLDLLISWYRDLLLTGAGVNLDACIHRDLLAVGEDGSRPPPLSPPAALRCLDLLLGARAAITKRNANVRLTLESLFLGLASNATRTP